MKKLNPQSSLKTVLIVDNSPVLGGAELYTIELAEHINEDYRFIFAVTDENRVAHLVQNNFVYEVFSSKKLKTRNLIALLINLSSSVCQLLNIVYLHKVDVIQTNTARTNIIGAIVSILTQKKLIWVHHAYDFPPLLFKILSFIPHKIICVSKTVRKYYMKYLSAKNKIDVIYNGIDFKGIPQETSDNFLENNYNVKASDYKIGTIGRIERRKGQEYLIKSMPLVVKKYSNSKFFIIGDVGPGEEDYFDYLKKLINKLKMEDRIIFTGFINERFEVISSLDVVVQVSSEPETFGRVITEAMSLLKPVVATNIGSFCEIIENNINGILIPPKDSDRLAEAIIKLLGDKSLSIKLGNNGKKTVIDKYNIDNTINKYKELYSKLLS